MSLARLILTSGIAELYDSENRPLSEPTSQGQTLVVCPYQDRRRNLPMNRAALEQVSRHWSDIVDWVSPEGQTTSTLRDSLAVALLATIDPLLFRLQNPDSLIPVALSARYKACLGFCQVLTFLLWHEQHPDEARLSDYGSSAEFFLWLDSEAWLLGQEQVCAGPRPMIEELYRRFCAARPRDEHRQTIDDALELIALQFVHVMSNHQQSGSLAAQMLHRGHSPWLFALHHRPNRACGDVSKFFQHGALPPRVERLLQDPADEELFLRLFSCTSAHR